MKPNEIHTIWKINVIPGGAVTVSIRFYFASCIVIILLWLIKFWKYTNGGNN